MPEEWREGWSNAWLQKGFRPVQSAQYTYQDSNGLSVVRKTRFSLMNVSDGKDSGQKTFVVQHRTLQSCVLKADRWEPGIGKEGWEKGLLYGRPGLEKGLHEGQDIYLCEGERDADTVEREWSGCSTSHYQGAAGMRPDQAEVLAKAARIFIMSDRDVTGYQLAWHHLNLLVEVGVPQTNIVVVLPGVRQDKADITDHVNAGLGPDKLVAVRHSALRKQIETHGELPKGGRRWGYGYEAENLGEWTVTHG